MSRCRVIILEKLGVPDVMKILNNALDHLKVTVVKEKDELDSCDDIERYVCTVDLLFCNEDFSLSAENLDRCLGLW